MASHPGRGRPRKSDGERNDVTLRLSPDLVDRIAAAGPNWPTRARAALEAAFPEGAE